MALAVLHLARVCALDVLPRLVGDLAKPLAKLGVPVAVVEVTFGDLPSNADFRIKLDKLGSRKFPRRKLLAPNVHPVRAAPQHVILRVTRVSGRSGPVRAMRRGKGRIVHAVVEVALVLLH